MTFRLLMLLGLCLAGCADPNKPTVAANDATQAPKVVCQPVASTGSHMIDRDCSQPHNVSTMSAADVERMTRMNNQSFGGNK